MRSSDKFRAVAAVAALGGALIAAAMVAAVLAVGAPQRVPAAPGQRYRAPHGSVELVFPPLGASGQAPSVASSGRASMLEYGKPTRVGPYVFIASRGPAASVSAFSPRGESETVTQPASNAAFVSSSLTFGVADGAHPQDVFDVNALHRRIRADYYAGLPSRGIDIPFLLLQVSEQNGGVVFQGVAVSDKPVRAPGIVLKFHLTTYPAVEMTSAPQFLPLAVGCGLVLAGLLLAGLVRSLTPERPASGAV